MLLKPRHQASSSHGSLCSPLLEVDTSSASPGSYSDSGDSDGTRTRSSSSSGSSSPDSSAPAHHLPRTSSSGSRRASLGTPQCEKQSRDGFGHSNSNKPPSTQVSGTQRWRTFFLTALLWSLVVAFGGGCHLMGRYSIHDETSAAAQQQFVLQTEPRMCMSRINTRFTTSIGQAMVLCLRTGGCTAVLRNHLTGRTDFCRTLRRTSPMLKRQLEEASGALRWLYTSAVVGSCELYDWKLAAIHEDSGATTQCRTIGLHGFEFQFSPIPCPPQLLLGRRNTRHLQAAAVECLGDPSCVDFARDLHTGDTLFCGQRPSTSSSSSSSSTPSSSSSSYYYYAPMDSEDDFGSLSTTSPDSSSSLPTPDPALESLAGHRWIYGCRRGQCPLTWRPQDQSFVLNLPYASSSSSSARGSSQRGGAAAPISAAGGGLGGNHQGPHLDGASSSSSPRSLRLPSLVTEPSEESAASWDGAESLQDFTLVPGHTICKPLQVLAFGPTPSDLFAAHFCLSEPHCTVFTRSAATGDTWFCQSYDRIEPSGPGEGYVTAMRLGCEHIDGRVGITDVFTGHRPNCARPRGVSVAVAFEGSCPGGLHRIPVFTDATWASSAPRFACDECASNGVCGQLEAVLPDATMRGGSGGGDEGLLEVNGTALRLGLEEAAQKHLASEALGETANELAGAINPSIFSHNGRQHVVFRSTEALRCNGNSVHSEWRTDHEKDVIHSIVSLCSLQSPETEECLWGPAACPREPRDCVALAEPGSPSLPLENLDPSHMMIDDYAFVGPEDPRAFSFRGRIYVAANIGIVVMPWSWEAEHRFHYEVRVRRLVLVRLDASGSRADRALLLSIPGTARTEDNKNAVPLVSSDGSAVFLVHNILPYRICRLDVATGNCEAINAAAEAVSRGPPGQPKRPGLPISLDPASSAVLSHNGGVRGGSPFVQTPWGFLGVVHRKQELEMGRLYSHKWALLSSAFPHLPLWLSPSFRLPSAPGLRSSSPNETVSAHHEASVEDIQFASGLVVDAASGRGMITYGVGDCFSAIATVELPVTELEAAAAADNPAATLRPVTPEPLQDVPGVVAPGGRSSEQGDESPMAPLRVRWDSPVTDLSGFATVSRAFASRLLSDSGMSLQIMNRGASGGPEPYEEDKYGKVYEAIVSTNLKLPVQPDVTVRLHWPPNFQPVSSGKLVVYLPWEFEVIPDAWVDYLNRAAHEVWVPAEFVRSGFLRSGVDASRVHVVGHGAPDDVCQMKDPRHQAAGTNRRTRRSFRFLYHGGMLWRKGVDLLLKAYADEFTVEDDVLLVIHSVYGDDDVHQHVKEYLAAMGSESPRVHLMHEKLNATELASMYASADAFVHPSRSEGFGLGIVEAMAYGVPPVLPSYGPPVEFVSNRTGFLFPCEAVPCDKPPCRAGSQSVFSEDWTTSSPLMWGEYETEDLGAAMRFAYENPEEVERRGREARRHACSEMSWDSVYDTMRQRLEDLAGPA